MVLVAPYPSEDNPQPHVQQVALLLTQDGEFKCPTPVLQLMQSYVKGCVIGPCPPSSVSPSRRVPGLLLLRNNICFPPAAGDRNLITRQITVSFLHPPLPNNSTPKQHEEQGNEDRATHDGFNGRTAEEEAATSQQQQTRRILLCPSLVAPGSRPEAPPNHAYRHNDVLRLLHRQGHGQPRGRDCRLGEPAGCTSPARNFTR